MTWLVFEIYVEVWTTSLVPAAKPFCASLRPLAPDVDALREQVDAALLRADIRAAVWRRREPPRTVHAPAAPS